MTQISRTVQVAQRGQQLRNTIDGLVNELASRSPYSLVRLNRQWQSNNRLLLTAEPHMVGSVTVREGNPSTVTLQMDPTSALARGMTSRIQSDLAAVAQRLQQAGATTTTPSTATTTTTNRQRTYDPARAERAVNVFEAIAQSFQRGVEQAFGQPSEAEPVIEQMLTEPGVTRGELRTPGKPLPPAGYEAPLEPYVPTSSTLPWGWILGGGVALTGIALLAGIAKSRREEREWERELERRERER